MQEMSYNFVIEIMDMFRPYKLDRKQVRWFAHRSTQLEDLSRRHAKHANNRKTTYYIFISHAEETLKRRIPHFAKFRAIVHHATRDIRRPDHLPTSTYSPQYQIKTPPTRSATPLHLPHTLSRPLHNISAIPEYQPAHPSNTSPTAH